MDYLSERYLKTGGDPRTLSDYTALRNELAKLSHPARPDVNWYYAEKLCLSLFEQNGVELQTASWYTITRTQLAGLSGLNEGLSILEALITHQWNTLWPQPVSARIEILTGLSQRLQHLVRLLPFNHRDLRQLYRAEQQFTRLDTALQYLELKHLSSFDPLRILMHNNAIQLEKSDGASSYDQNIQSSIGMSVDAIQGISRLSATSMSTENESHNTVKWVYIVQPEYQPNIDVVKEISAPTRFWRPFTLGMLSMLLASTAILCSWHILHRPDPLQVQLMASLTSLPSVLPLAQLQRLRQQSNATRPLIIETERQLTNLSQLSPDWQIDYGDQLVKQAQILWPAQSESLVQHWQQLKGASITPENVNGWYQGMTTLQQLADKLNALDEKRGKYLTVSELKSSVFTMMTHFRQSVPIEEQLRLIHLQQMDSPGRQQQIQQTEQHLRGQINSLQQEKIRMDREK